MPKRTCAQCNAEFVVPEPGAWVYQIKEFTDTRHGRIKFFCTRGCKRKYQELHPGRKEYNRWDKL